MVMAYRNKEALEFCREKTFGQLLDLTHQEPAWQDALENEYLNHEILANDVFESGEIVKTIRETAPRLVL